MSTYNLRARVRQKFILRRFIVPLAHHLFGVWIVQGGEGLIRQFANQVFCSVDFKGVEH